MKIVITIEDSEHEGLARVTWKHEPEGEIDWDSTPATRVAHSAISYLYGAKVEPNEPLSEGEVN